MLGDLWYYDRHRNDWVLESAAEPIGPNGANDTNDNGDSQTPVPRTLGAAWSDAADTFWLFGGSTGSGILGDFWKLPALRRSWVKVAQYPLGRWGAAAWTDNATNFRLFAGQRRCDGSQPAEMRSDVLVYSRFSDKWTFKGDGVLLTSGNTLPSPRLCAATCVVGTELWLFGGLAPVMPHAVQLGDLWNFDALSEQCRQVDVDVIGPAPAPRVGATLFASPSGNLYLFGGQRSDVRNDLWIFDVSRRCWTWKDGLRNERYLSISEYRDAVALQGDDYPSPRTNASTWTDEDGNFWMFGGYGLDKRDVRMLDDPWTYRF